MFTVIAMLLSGLPATTPPMTALETAIEVVERQEAAIQGLQLEYTAKSTVFDPEQPKRIVDRQILRLVEKRSGEKYHFVRSVQRRVGGEGAPTEDVSEHAFDGKEYREFDRSGGLGGAHGTDPGAQSSVLTYLYCAVNGYSSLLREFRSSGTAEWAKLDGVTVLRCRISSTSDWVTSAVQTLDLDPAHHWQPLRYLSQISVNPETPHLRSETVENRTLRFHEADGFCLPAETRFVISVMRPEGLVVETQQDRTLEVVKFNPEFTDADFMIQFPEESRVYDRDRDFFESEGEFVRGAAGAALSGGAPAQTAAGVQYFWWADYRIWLAITGGFVVCLVIALRRRAAGATQA